MTGQIRLGEQPMQAMGKCNEIDATVGLVQDGLALQMEDEQYGKKTYVVPFECFVDALIGFAIDSKFIKTLEPKDEPSDEQ